MDQQLQPLLLVGKAIWSSSIHASSTGGWIERDGTELESSTSQKGLVCLCPLIALSLIFSTLHPAVLAS
jgi:hypothetical protein